MSAQGIAMVEDTMAGGEDVKPSRSVEERRADMLKLYEATLQVTDRMVSAAREADWDAVLNLGAEYLECSRGIQALGSVAPRDDAERACRHDLLVRILENDATTRNLISPCLARLSDMIGTTRRQQSLHATYGQHQTASVL